MPAPQLTVLIDNETCRPDLASQHGLSIWIEAGGLRILFDTGSSGKFLDNARKLGIDVSKADYLVLSHGHFDHTSGVPEFLDIAPRAQVILPDSAWGSRQVERRGNTPLEIGIRWPRTRLENRKVVSSGKPLEIVPGIWVTGSLTAFAGAVATAGFLRGAGEPDTFADEQALLVNTVEGLVVITGCTHTGLLHLLDAARQVAGTDRLYALIGGLHLWDWTAEACRELAEALAELGIRHVWANHCTRRSSWEGLRTVLGEKAVWAGSGFHTELSPQDRV